MVSEIILSGQLCSNGEKNILFGICNVISSFVNVPLHHLHRASPYDDQKDDQGFGCFFLCSATR